MDAITTAEVASLEGDLQFYYGHTANISRSVKAADQYGGQTQNWSVIHTEVRCDVQPVATRVLLTAVVGEQIESRLNYTVSLPPGTDIKIHDRITITSVTPNREMVVASVLAPESIELELQVVATLEGEPLV